MNTIETDYDKLEKETKNKLKLIAFVEYFYENKGIDFWILLDEFKRKKQNEK